MKAARIRMGCLIGALMLLGLAGSASATCRSQVGVGSDRSGRALSASEARGDFNGDGIADVAIVSRRSHGVSVRLGDGTGGFGSPASFATPSRPSCIAAGDVNGDGAVDLIVGGRRSRRISILPGDGTGGFGPPATFATRSRPSCIAVGDVNGDGAADLALSSGRSSRVSILLGDGTGGFQAATDQGRAYRAAAVTGPTVVALTLSPSTIAGGSGASSQGTVTLSDPAPAGETLVLLSSSLTELAASTPSLVIPEGATSSTFIVGTNPLYRRYSALAFSATITATNPGDTSSRSATVTVTAQARPGGFPSDTSQRSGRMCGGAFPASQGDRGILFNCTLAPNFGSSGTCTFRQECTLGCQTVSAQSFTSFKHVCATTTPFPVTVTPRLVVGGGAITGTVNFATASQPEPLDTEAFAFSNNAVAAVLPSGFFPVPTGATSVGFGVSTIQVTSPAFAAIGVNALTPQSGGFEGQRLGLAWLAVVPAAGAQPALPTLATLTLNPTSVVGGNPLQGTVTLTGAAPAGGAAVVVASHNTSLWSVPTIVTVPAGATSATFTVTTFAVTSPTFAFISARYNGEYREAIFTLTPPPPAGSVITGLSFNPDPVVGGNTSIGTVTVSAAAPAGGTTVSLVSEAAVGPHVVSVPASVTVPAGATSASFAATTGTVSQIAASNVRATLGNSTWNTLLDVVVLFANMTLNPTTVVGGNPSTGTVTLNGPAPPGGALVTLTSNNTAVASVQASVTVLAGATSANFAVTTFAVAAAAFPIITASHGSVSFQRQLTVNPDSTAPPTLASLSLNPTSVTGGNSSTGTATLSAAAPSGGAVVTLSSGNTAVATVPASVTVAAGATSASFTVATAAVAAPASVTLSGSFGGMTRSATLTVSPPTQNVTLTVTATGRSGERVTSSPAGINVSVGSTGSASFAVNISITLSVTNGRDAIWSGACSSGGNKTKTCIFTITGNALVTGNVQ